MIDPIETPEQIAGILKREFEAADSYYSQLEELMHAAFAYYEGQPLGNEIDGRSQIVLPDVQESVDYMAQSVLRTVISAERVVEFEAVDEGDEESADDATEAVNYEFLRRSDGYRVLLDVVNDGLLRKVGIFKAQVERKERVKRERVILPAEAALGLEAEGVEFEDIEQQEDGSIAVTIKQTVLQRRYTGEAIPPHEFRFSPDARHEDTCNYTAHVSPKTRGELVAMGFDRDQVYGLPGINRNVTREAQSNTLDYLVRDETSRAVEEVELCEEYAHLDIDGDGIAERIQAFRVENEILRWRGEPMVDEMGQPVIDEMGEQVFAEGPLALDTVDEQPFSVFCPFPRSHRLVGYSLADKVMDVQYLRTMLTRQMIDGMAFSNMPRPIVAENGSGEHTLDDILNPIPGAPIRVRDVSAVQPMQNNFNLGASLQAIEWASGERESRTGITRLNQGLDADALNKTASGTAMMQAQGQQIEEFIARNLAEAMSRFFMKLYRLMKAEGEPFRIKAKGQYKMVDPRLWPDEICVRIRVGLGTNNKDKRVAALMALQGPLQEAIGAGLSGPQHAFRWLDRFVRDTGIGRGEDFMFDPEDPEVQARMQQEEQAPDPELVEVQAKMQLEREKAQEAAQLQRDKAAADIETQREKHLMDMQVARERAELEIELARQKAAAEIQLARERAAADLMTKHNVSQQRMGGDLDK